MLCLQLLAEGCLGRRVMQQGLQAQAGHRPHLCLATRSCMATSWQLPVCPPKRVQVYLNPHPTCAFFQKKSKFTRARAPRFPSHFINQQSSLSYDGEDTILTSRDPAGCYCPSCFRERLFCPQLWLVQRRVLEERQDFRMDVASAWSSLEKTYS